MTEGRGGTVALVVVIVVYALLFGAWFITAGQVDETAALPTPTLAPTATASATKVPSQWRGLSPTPSDIPTAGLLRPPVTLAPVPPASP